MASLFGSKLHNHLMYTIIVSCGQLATYKWVQVLQTKFQSFKICYLIFMKLQTCHMVFGSWTHHSKEIDVDFIFPSGLDLSTYQRDFKVGLHASTYQRDFQVGPQYMSVIF